jgi:predicted Rossmann fold flavoprotein
VVVVGAGAAGLATAIFARRLNPSLSVAVLDGAKKPGAKILVSGGSRCNVTNAVVSERDFWGGKSTVVRRVLRALPVADTVAFFDGIGVRLHEEADGKLFPDSNRSRDVLDALLRETATVGATLLVDHRVLDLVTDAGGFHAVTNRGDVTSSAVVMATGGLSLPKSGSDGAGLDIVKRLGHTVVPTTPALTPLVLDESDVVHRTLSGVSFEAELTVWIDGAVAIRLRGAMLWTHFGVSGPVALDASRHLLRAHVENRSTAITVKFRPGQSLTDVDAEWVLLGRVHPKASLQTMLATMVPASMAEALLAAIAIDARTDMAHLSRDDRRRLTRALVEWPLPVAGTRGYGVAEATAGGVALNEIDPATMESRVCNQLFLVGEMLDVDGRIGGFNFQWAWSSAYVAARAIAKAVAPHQQGD